MTSILLLTTSYSLQCFHLVEFNGTGGQSTLVDGFKVIKELKENDREAFDFLSSTPIPFHYKDNDHYLTQTRPIITLDKSGFSPISELISKLMELRRRSVETQSEQR